MTRVTQDKEAHYSHDNENAAALYTNSWRYARIMHENICHSKILRDVMWLHGLYLFLLQDF